VQKPWKTKEWREKRAEILEGKSCEWCSSKIALSIHHKEPEQPYLVRYKIIQQVLLEKLVREGVYKPINKVEESVCPECGSHSVREFRATRFRCLDCNEYFSMNKKLKGPLRISKEDFADFVEKYSPKIKEYLQTKRQKDFEKYMTLDNTMILCKKCHMAIGKGMVLCQVCKQGYHRPNFDRCFKCYSKTEKGQEYLNDNEMVDYTHPWCNRIFKIERMFLCFDGNPSGCCVRRCVDGQANSCKIAEEHFKNGDNDEL
jgi:hypothetical protein